MQLWKWEFVILNSENESVFLTVTSWEFSKLWRTSPPYPSDHHSRRDDSTLEACLLLVESAATGAGWVGPTTHVTSYQLPCFCGHRFTNSNAKVKRRVPDIALNIPRLCFETYEGIVWYLLLCCEKNIMKGLVKSRDEKPCKARGPNKEKNCFYNNQQIYNFFCSYSSRCVVIN